MTGLFKINLGSGIILWITLIVHSRALKDNNGSLSVFSDSFNNNHSVIIYRFRVYNKYAAI